MATVQVTQPLFPEAVELLEEAGHHVRVRAGGPMDERALAEAAAGADALITLLTDMVGGEVFDANPQLRVVANVAAGVDNIDLDAAARHGVVVTNTPGVLTDATADLTMALILAVARRLVPADAFVRAGRFEGWELHQPHTGTDLVGRTLGVVGLGSIGHAVARRAALGFGMHIVYTTRSGPRPEADETLGARRVELDELLETADVVSLHAPLTPETHHLVDESALARMKATALLINTARGPLVDERALARALQAGQIAGAGLDVYEHEPHVEAGLVDMTEQVVLLPHIGSATEGTRRRMATTAADCARAVLADEEPAHPVAGA